MCSFHGEETCVGMALNSDHNTPNIVSEEPLDLDAQIKCSRFCMQDRGLLMFG